MIHEALEFTADALNQFLKNKFAVNENKVLVNNLIETDGCVPIINQNKLIISLISITTESALTLKEKTANDRSPDPGPGFNIDILLSQNFDNYMEGVKFLEAAIMFFDTNPILTGSAVNVGLKFNMERISNEQMCNLWTAIGAKYKPAVIYKIRITQN